MHCPHCGSADHYYRVSALSQTETSQVDTTTKGVGVGVSTSGIGVGVGKGRTQGTIQTNLATKLEPPSPPDLPMGGCGVLGSWIAGFIGLGVSGAIFLGSDRGVLALLGSGFFLVFGVVFIVFRKAIARGETEQLAAYELEKDAWERSWYCKKCGEFSTPNRE